MKKVIVMLHLLSALTIYGQKNNNAVIPTCPEILLPVVEIQVNNTASNHDDYGSLNAYTVCSARIVNYADEAGNSNFAGGLPVEIRNPASQSKLIFSNTGDMDAGVSSVFDTLPEDGSWRTFYVKGTIADTV